MKRATGHIERLFCPIYHFFGVRQGWKPIRRFVAGPSGQNLTILTVILKEQAKKSEIYELKSRKAVKFPLETDWVLKFHSEL